ncbi:P-type conjugative transfer protein TrbG [Myxococcus sp. MISCRS1]|uniref:P-type conjugative transfer protein TrbG n=1 Tax=Myxococcus sp. MISCRS1 TaxID=2996786 RepID=UPI00226D6325|nr:P-type conjugative transfer protein TrbG [Myxococcus sp. MISCRS1]MCY1003971.1 P-type conjugative transfer protein TrbG [Myxococcus sp. MISCRS1]
MKRSNTVMHNTRCLLYSILFATTVACTTSSPAQRSAPETYVPAKPIVEPAAAPPVASPQVAPQQFIRKLPDPSSSRPSAPQRPEAVVEAATRRATQGPDADGYFNAIMQYTYEPGALYQVYAAPCCVTDIQLQPGEKIVGKPVAGDTVRWKAGVAQGAEGGQEVWHVYVRPLKDGLHTTLSINTNRRTYRLQMKSYPETYMVAVQWMYPPEEMEMIGDPSQGPIAMAAPKPPPMPVVDVANTNFGYRIDVLRGSPSWKPVKAFDDGRKTYISFPTSIVNREAPALYVMSRDNKPEMANYRIRGNVYEVDRLFDAAELRLGQNDQDVVRVVRTTTDN